jgi:hypothetical protein
MSAAPLQSETQKLTGLKLLKPKYIVVDYLLIKLQFQSTCVNDWNKINVSHKIDYLIGIKKRQLDWGELHQLYKASSLRSESQPRASQEQT